ncbi:hypothetical protein C5C39_06940 [Rathayibacter sp. AY1F3]|nr:hypothetical protein C5C39_06940 [Rathayibacter sp. AY1F3]
MLYPIDTKVLARWWVITNAKRIPRELQPLSPLSKDALDGFTMGVWLVVNQQLMPDDSGKVKSPHVATELTNYDADPLKYLKTYALSE